MKIKQIVAAVMKERRTQLLLRKIKRGEHIIRTYAGADKMTEADLKAAMIRDMAITMIDLEKLK